MPRVREHDHTLPPPPRKSKAQGITPGLYIVATPIGNLQDITVRALEILRGVSLIACEDTRVSRRLLNAYAIKNSLIAYHDHNADEVRPKLLQSLNKGEAVALISDAGTPLISDPGYKLVRAAHEAGVPVVPVPGPSALLAGLVASGLPSNRFLFEGFLSPKMGARRQELDALRTIPATLIFFEAPSRLAATLHDMAAILGSRAAVVARELTKMFEEIRRGSLTELAEFYKEAGAPKGEIVLVVGPPGEEEGTTIDITVLLKKSLKTLSLKEAVAQIAAQTGLARRIVYAQALALTRGK